jgi:hypothetical protein
MVIMFYVPRSTPGRTIGEKVATLVAAVSPRPVNILSHRAASSREYLVTVSAAPFLEDQLRMAGVRLPVIRGVK